MHRHTQLKATVCGLLTIFLIQGHGAEPVAEAEATGMLAPHLVCHMRLGEQQAVLHALPQSDPYAPTRYVFEDRYSLSAVVVGDGARVDYLSLTVHDLSQGGSPVVAHQMQWDRPSELGSPGMANADSSGFAPTLTGWQHVYSGKLEREFVYGCAWVGNLVGTPGQTSAIAAPPVEQPTVALTDAGPTVRMAWLGDIMLADGPGRLIRRGGNPFAPTAPVLAKADVRVANLECVVATSGKAIDKPWTFKASPSVLPLLKQHVDVVSLANNHSGDFGPGAFTEMLKRLDGVGLPYFGGGHTLRAAHEPHIIVRKGLKIALLGYDEMFPRRFEAGADWPGVAWSEDAQVAYDIRQARKQADIVIPYMHWGQEHEPKAHARQRQLARLMIDAGADAVVGTHPHVVQDVERYKGKPIVYSLGNFVFDGFSSPDNNTGWILWLDVNRSGVQQWRVEEVHQDKSGSPHPVKRQTLQPPMPSSDSQVLGAE